MIGRKMKTGEGSLAKKWLAKKWRREGKWSNGFDSLAHRMGEGIGFEIPGNFVTFCEKFVQIRVIRVSLSSVKIRVNLCPSAVQISVFHLVATHLFANKSRSSFFCQ